MRHMIVCVIGLLMLSTIVGCTCPAMRETKALPMCPRCRVQMVRHRFGRSGVPGHVHTKYVCPSCRAEWTGPAADEEGCICPKCGCGLKECPACAAKGKS